MLLFEALTVFVRFSWDKGLGVLKAFAGCGVGGLEQGLFGLVDL